VTEYSLQKLISHQMAKICHDIKEKKKKEKRKRVTATCLLAKHAVI
jgi:hypothetical protein